MPAFDVEVRNTTNVTQTGTNDNHYQRVRRSADTLSDTTIDFVVDFTGSMEGVLPAVYYFCMDCMNALKGFPGRRGKLRFGLTVLGDYVVPCDWGSEQYWTDKPVELLEKLVSQDVGGGSNDGFEPIHRAVEASLRKLSQVPAGERVIFLFSDAVPAEQDKLNFYNGESVRSAICFVPEFAPKGRYHFCLTNDRGESDRHKSVYEIDLNLIAEKRLLMKRVEIEGQEDNRKIIYVDDKLAIKQLICCMR